VSGVRYQLMTQLSHFDDDAFAALANRGLVRRAQKDLEKQPASVVEESAETLTMSVGDHRVRFDTRGPAHAQCTCPASGVCQHILAAAISLQRLSIEPNVNVARIASEAAIGVDVENGEEGGARLRDLNQQLLRITAAELTKHCGKPGYRWAWQFVQDLNIEQDVMISGERHIVIGFTRPRMTFRYMGGGPESLIADSQTSQIEKYRVAAVLAYRRANNAEITLPEPTAKDRTASLNLGKDHTAPEDTADSQRDSRARLRASAKLLLIECVELGLSHLSRGIQERFSTLAVWAQGAEYYRLASLLRRLADHVDLQLDRAGSADERRLFDELTITFGLVSALEQAAKGGFAPRGLIGQARSQYEQTGTLELIGLGAQAWRSSAGYVGLTMVFWCPAEQAFFSCTDARPEIQRGFNPIVRYKASGPWSGLGAPEQATGRCVLLTAAQVNSLGRVSASESISAMMRSVDTSTGLAQQLKPFSDWTELMQARALARRGLLAEPQPMKDWFALQPARFGAARFDAARQTLIWPLYDKNEIRIDAELAYSDYTAHAIARVEQISPTEIAEGTVLVARLHRGHSGLVAEPLSIVRVHTERDQNPVDALHFDAAQQQGFASKWLAKIRTISKSQDFLQQPAPAMSTPSSLRDFRRWLQSQAERGVTSNTVDTPFQELDSRRERISANGFTAFNGVALVHKAASSQLIASHYMCMQYERLIDDTQEAIV